jgi:hypothetical protein
MAYCGYYLNCIIKRLYIFILEVNQREIGDSPRKISFMTTVQIFNEGILSLIVLSEKGLKYAIDGLLNAIASIPIGQQKRKPEPRAVKRRPKSYPLLKKPRNKAREAINS